MRMPLRTGIPNQHQLLIDLEAAGHVVAYATPDFVTIIDLDRYFVAQEVPFQSRYFAPSEIGVLDATSHHVAYRNGVPNISIRSEPKKVEGKFGLEGFSKRVGQAVQAAEEQDSSVFLKNLITTISQITKTDTIVRPSQEPRRGPSQQVKQLARQVAYLAQVRLGCAFMITGRTNDAPQP